MDEEIKAALECIYKASGLPFAIMSHHGGVVFSCPEVYGSFLDLSNPHVNAENDTLGKSENPLGITLVESGRDLISVTALTDENHFVMTAPAPLSEYGESSLAGALEMIQKERRQEFLLFWRQIPIMGYTQLTSIVRLIVYTIRKEMPEGVNYYQFISSEEEIRKTDDVKENRETAVSYRNVKFDSWNWVKRVCTAIEAGDLAILQEIVKEDGGNQVQLSADSLTQAKNMFVFLMPEVIRAAEEGGLSRETCITLAEDWCQSLEHYRSPLEILKFRTACLLKLCLLVKETGARKDWSYLSRKAAVYVQRHIHEPLSVSKTAEAIGTNRSTLSTCFKKDSGIELGKYMEAVKLNEAERLLRETDLPILEISELLSYSSQSHFTELFKKQYGKTPAVYRREKGK